MPGKMSGGCLALCCLLAVLLPEAARPAPPQQQSASSSPAQTTSAKDKKKREHKVLKELDSVYRTWLEEDVVYIISPQEREAFLQLSTNEEREQFIEQFWQRRNPDPESPNNEFKEEHYRRIAYANARFASGLPGWKTDRGRTYIIWGPPDQVDSHPSGGPYGRTADEGGGYTMAYPFEDWRYHHLEGIGSDITLEFVDPTRAGEYHLTMDPCEKDALAKEGLSGPTEMEAEGMTSKATRSMGADGTTCGPTMIGTRMSTTEFDRLTQFASVQVAPPVKFKDLEALVSSRLVRDQIPFEYRFDFLRVTSDTVLVPITLQIANRKLTFESHQGVDSAVLEVFGQVTTLTGRVIQTFEDTINRDFPESQLHELAQGRSMYQKAVPLRPGLYRLDLVIKDVHGGNVGVVSTPLVVPRYDEDKLSASTMILADRMVPVSSKEIGVGQFVIGDTIVRPRVDEVFNPQEPVRVYLQIYNLGLDQKNHSDVTFDYVLSSVAGGAAKRLYRQKETSDKYGQTGQQLTIQKRIPVAGLAPGRYRFTVYITDNVSKQSISPTAEFTVQEAVAAASKN